MDARNENELAPARNKDGDLVYAAIADFTVEDVWEWIGLVRSGLIPSYSDFNELTRIYADAGNTSCAVISDVITEGLKKERDSCGARTGCLMCEKIVKDQSLLAMNESDMERYGYMAAPNSLRNFIMNTQWDFNRRQWVGRQIKDNTITIRPDTYSHDMCIDLLRYALTCDVNEKQKAQEAGLSGPRFELVPIEALIAIDALWSLQGWHKPFQAVMEYLDIYENGKRYLAPEVLAVKRQPMAKPRYISVLSFHTDRIGVFSSLRYPLLEMHGDSPCMGTKQTSSGKTVMDVEMHTSFTVDTEGAFLALDFELENLVKKHRNASATHGLTQGYKW